MHTRRGVILMMRDAWHFLGVLALVALFLTASGFAQSNAGRILGSVTDQSGAAVGGRRRQCHEHRYRCSAKLDY